MKWIGTAIGAVIAIISIGIVATGVYSMTQETVKREVTTFEILTENTVTNGTFNELSSIFSGFESEVVPFNLLYNDTLYNAEYVYMLYTIQINIIQAGQYDYFFIYDDDTWLQEDPQVIILSEDDIIEVSHEVSQFSDVSLTLILLIPLVFVGGVLAFLLNKQEL